MKTQPFFAFTKQNKNHIASPHLRLPQAAAPAPVLGSCEDFTRLGSLRRHCLDCLECWHWWHWHWHPMKHAMTEIMVDRDHGKTMSVDVSSQFKVGTCHYIILHQHHKSTCVQHVVIDKSIETRWGYDNGWTDCKHIGTHWNMTQSVLNFFDHTVDSHLLQLNVPGRMRPVLKPSHGNCCHLSHFECKGLSRTLTWFRFHPKKQNERKDQKEIAKRRGFRQFRYVSCFMFRCLSPSVLSSALLRRWLRWLRWWSLPGPGAAPRPELCYDMNVMNVINVNIMNVIC